MYTWNFCIFFHAQNCISFGELVAILWHEVLRYLSIL